MQVGAISTPTFIIIPMITIWFGIFPIIINWWAALGVTIYGISTQLVRYFVIVRTRVPTALCCCHLPDCRVCRTRCGAQLFQNMQR